MNVKNWLVAFALGVTTTSSAIADDRLFSSDRPGKSYSPFTVPTTHFQIETDTLKYTRQNNVRSLQTLDPTIRYGVTNRLELNLSLGGWITQWTRVGRHNTNNISGYGDTNLDAKFNVIGNDGGKVAAAVVVNAKIPTAKKGLGNGQMEYSLSLPLQYSVTDAFSVGLMPQAQIQNNALNNGKQMTYSGSVFGNYAITDKLGVSLEVYQSYSTDKYTKSQRSIDPSITYMITPSLQIDVGAYVGLNKDTPSMVAYIGISKRF